jgi:hypothetical protein
MTMKPSLRHLVFGLSFVVIAAPVCAADCSSTPAQRNDFIATALIRAIDAGREASGSYPSWVERYLRDADLLAEAVSRFCERSPQVSLETALSEVAGKTR